jgi:hypothetical protein
MGLPSITVHADWDADAQLWIATSADAPAFVVASDSLCALPPKVFAALRARAAADGVDFDQTDVPVTILM